MQKRSNHHRLARSGGQLFKKANFGVAAFGEHENAVVELPKCAHEGAQFGIVSKPRWHGDAAFAVVGGRGAGGKADRTGTHRLAQDVLHGRNLVGIGSPLGGISAHHIGAD